MSQRLGSGDGRMWVLAGGLAAGLLVAWARPAAACSCVTPTNIHEVLPEDGATGVPTNVVPWVVGVEVELLDESGALVPSTASFRDAPVCTFAVELKPDEPLEPQSTYTLRAKPRGPTSDAVDEVTFTTGKGPDLEKPEPPDVDFLVFDAAAFQNSCVYSQVQACAVTRSTQLLDVRFDSGARNLRYVGTPEGLDAIELDSPTGEGCIEARARSLTGMLSAPKEICFDRKTLPVLEEREDLGWVTCESDVIQELATPTKSGGEAGSTGEGDPTGPARPAGETEPGGGCSLTAAGRAPTHWSALALLGVVLTTALGRRRTLRD